MCLCVDSWKFLLQITGKLLSYSPYHQPESVTTSLGHVVWANWLHVDVNHDYDPPTPSFLPTQIREARCKVETPSLSGADAQGTLSMVPQPPKSSWIAERALEIRELWLFATTTMQGDW